MYDICDRQSFESISRWYDEIESHAGNCLIVLVGNKVDCDKSPREVLYEEGKSLAKSKLSLFFMECSNKTGENVDAILARLVVELMNKPLPEMPVHQHIPHFEKEHVCVIC